MIKEVIAIIELSEVNSNWSKIPIEDNTFSFNIKYLLLKLLCTLARLCEGTSLKLLILDFIVIRGTCQGYRVVSN